MSTDSIGATARDHSTVTIWEAQLGTGTEIGEMYDDATFDEGVTFDDSDPDSYTLSVAAGERHNGVEDTGARFLITANNRHHIVNPRIADFHATFEWIVSDRNGRDDEAMVWGATASVVTIVRNSMFYGGVGGDVWHGLIFANVRDVLLHNCMLFDTTVSATSSFPAKGVAINSADSAGGFLNNTVFDIRNTHPSGILWGVHFTANNTNGLCKNSISVGHSGNTQLDFNLLGTNPDSDFNLSEDASADDAGGSNNQLSKSVASVDFVSTSHPYDLHLNTDSSTAHALGGDLGTGEQGNEIDIDGTDRDADIGSDAWDIGAHQLIVAGAPAAPTRMLLTGVGV